MAEEQKKQTWRFGKVLGCENWLQSSVWTVTDPRYQGIQRETWPSFNHSRSQIRDSIDAKRGLRTFWGTAPWDPQGWRGTAGLHNDHTEVPKAGSSGPHSLFGSSVPLSWCFFSDTLHGLY